MSSLIIHGGVGTISNKKELLEKIHVILKEGSEMLSSGASAVDVVEYCVIRLEDDEFFNAGKGSVLNEGGSVELDAAIMSGDFLMAGATAGVRGIKNPISLARTIMEKSEHVFLVGAGAEDFAGSHGLKKMPDSYFVTSKRVEQWEAAKSAGVTTLDHAEKGDSEKKYGTVGAVALDDKGKLAAATSTGGIVNKKFGRVGDSPIIGAGVYADNNTCAVSATGIGEHILRTVLAKDIADRVRFEGMTAQEAAQKGIDYLVEQVDGKAGVIVIDKNGKCGVSFSTPDMVYGGVCNGITMET